MILEQIVNQALVLLRGAIVVSKLTIFLLVHTFILRWYTVLNSYCCIKLTWTRSECLDKSVRS